MSIYKKYYINNIIKKIKIKKKYKKKTKIK